MIAKHTRTHTQTYTHTHNKHTWIEFEWLILTLNMIRSHRRNLCIRKITYAENRRNQPIETCNDVKTCLYASVITTNKWQPPRWQQRQRQQNYMACTLFVYADDTAQHSIAYDIGDNNIYLNGITRSYHVKSRPIQMLTKNRFLSSFSSYFSFGSVWNDVRFMGMGMGVQTWSQPASQLVIRASYEFSPN